MTKRKWKVYLSKTTQENYKEYKNERIKIKKLIISPTEEVRQSLERRWRRKRKPDGILQNVEGRKR